MKHKFFAAVSILLCLCLSFAGCAPETGTGGGGGSGEGPHTHEYASTWSSDDARHWHAATCGHDTERADVAAHTYKDGKCSICDHEHVSHTLGTYERTESAHSRTCSVCGKTVTEEHTFKDGVCTACEYEHTAHSYGQIPSFDDYEKTEDGHTKTCSVCGKSESAPHSYENGACLLCGYAHKEHAFGTYEKTEEGHARTCSVCGKVESTSHSYKNGKCSVCDYEHVGHVFEDGVCTVCGLEKPVYYFSADKSKIYFGEYPQSKVENATLEAALKAKAGALPTATNSGLWHSYGYYVNTVATDFMWYIDLVEDGAKYRGVYFTGYRPANTADGDGNSSQQDNNGYYTNNVYWFRYETIEWRVLENKNGTAFLFSNRILDGQQFYRGMDARTIGGATIYPNNYKESDLRTWLNGTFLQTAFDTAAGKIIKTSTLDNSAASAGMDSGNYFCESTQDKIFPLSLSEATSADYGFATDTKTSDPARILPATDYASCQGVFSMFPGAIWWWMRTPATTPTGVRYASGPANSDMYASWTQVGVAPALRIEL